MDKYFATLGIDLTLSQDLVSQVTNLLTGEGATSLCNAYTLISCVVEILMLKKWLAGRTDARFTPLPDTKSVKVTVDNRSLTINIHTFMGFRDPQCHEACTRIPSPLKKEGIRQMRIETAETTFSLDAEDLNAFELAQPSTILSDNTTPAAVLIEAPSFKDGNKWRVSLGERNSIHAAMLDTDFLAKIDGGERFGKGDLLLVDLRTTQTMVGEKIQISYEIIKVHEHRSAPQQGVLF